jgi:hypothetical protein
MSENRHWSEPFDADAGAGIKRQGLIGDNRGCHRRRCRDRSEPPSGRLAVTFGLPIFLIALALVLSACGRFIAISPSTAQPAPTAGVIVTGSAGDAPAGCDAHAVAQRLAGLFAAVSQADPTLVDEFFGQSRNAPFEWYSMDEVENNTHLIHHFVAHRFDELAAYWQARGGQHEHLQLLSAQVNGWDAGTDLVNLGPLAFTRTADDLGPLRTEYRGEGKGAYLCGLRAFVVLSLVTRLP